MQNDFEQLMAIKLPISFEERDGRYVFRIDAMKIVGYGSDVESAHRSLQEEKRRLIERHLATGSKDDIPWDESPRGEETFSEVGALRLFFMKSLIAGGVAILVLGLIAGGTSLAMQMFLGDLDQARIIAQVRSAISTMAAHADGLSNTAKKEIHRDLRAIVRELKPFADDLRPLVAPPPDGGSAVNPVTSPGSEQ